MEEEIILKSFKDTVFPKLTDEDGLVMINLILSVFGQERERK